MFCLVLSFVLVFYMFKMISILWLGFTFLCSRTHNISSRQPTFAWGVCFCQQWTCSIFMTSLLWLTTKFCCYFYSCTGKFPLVLFQSFCFFFLVSSLTATRHSHFISSFLRSLLYSIHFLCNFFFATIFFQHLCHIFYVIHSTWLSRWWDGTLSTIASSGAVSGWWRKIRVKVNATMLFKKL